MALAAMLGLLDDPIRFLPRMLGLTAPKSGVDPIEYKNPRQLVRSLRNPYTEEAAVARMQKMHYGAFYNDFKGVRPFGPRENVLRQRTMFSGRAERELLLKGKGAGGAIFGRPMKGLSLAKDHIGYNFGKLGGFLTVASAIGQSYMAPKGHKLSGFLKGGLELVGFGVGDVVGTALGGPVVGYALGTFLGEAGHKVGEAFQDFSELNYKLKHINMGGGYEDTQIAYTMRQRAAQELGSSVMNARQYLGKEALLFHG